MKRRKTILELGIIALIVLAGFLVLSGCDKVEPASVRERIAINAKEDSWIRYGADILFYSDDRSTQKIQLEGAAGNIDAEGTLDVEGASDLDSTLNVEGAVMFQSTLGVTGATYANAGAYVTGAISNTTFAQVGTFSRMGEQSVVVVTNAATFTPTGTYQPITSTATVTPLLSTSGYTAGDLLFLTNESATSIVLEDSGTLMLNTARTIGQYDILGLLFDGTNWLELWFNNN